MLLQMTVAKGAKKEVVAHLSKMANIDCLLGEGKNRKKIEGIGQ